MPYTIEQALRVMTETQRILDAPGYGADPRRARAAAETGPPADESFADEIVRQQEKTGANLSGATRLAAIARPDLRKAFVEQERAKRISGEQQDAEAARRRRNRNR